MAPWLFLLDFGSRFRAGGFTLSPDGSPWAFLSVGRGRLRVPPLRGIWETVCLQAGVCGHRGEPPGVLLLL